MIKNALFVATIRNPSVLFHQEAGCVVARLGRASVIDGGRDFSSLKNFIFGVPGKNDKGSIRYSRKDREDGSNVVFLQGVEYIVNGFEP
jgi:hypothetical protein